MKWLQVFFRYTLHSGPGRAATVQSGEQCLPYVVIQKRLRPEHRPGVAAWVCETLRGFCADVALPSARADPTETSPGPCDQGWCPVTWQDVGRPGPMAPHLREPGVRAPSTWTLPCVPFVEASRF